MMFDQEPQYMTEDELKMAEAEAEHGVVLLADASKVDVDALRGALSNPGRLIPMERPSKPFKLFSDNFVSVDYGESEPYTARTIGKPVTFTDVPGEGFDAEALTPAMARMLLEQVVGFSNSAINLEGGHLSDPIPPHPIDLDGLRRKRRAALMAFKPTSAPPSPSTPAPISAANPILVRKPNKHERRKYRNKMVKSMCSSSPFWNGHKAAARQVAHTMIGKACR